jgi:hypothetical protein
MKQELMQLIEGDHFRAMEFLDRASEAKRTGDTSTANDNFAEAYRLEKQAAEAMIPYVDIEPTRSILFRSAALLALECKHEDEAERLACLGLSGTPPSEIKTELRDVLVKVWQSTAA